MTVLPPNSTALEQAVDTVGANALADVPTPLRKLWNPASCPVELLPFLAWGVSIDFWNSDWTEAQKREAVAGAIEAQRRKGTRASLRAVLDRFDPLIGLVEWFEDKATMEPHTFRLDLPAPSQTSVSYDEDLIAALLRDITAVKPLRSHLIAVHRVRAQAMIGLASAVSVALFTRVDGVADKATASDPVWSTSLQTEGGEPMTDEAGTFLESA